MTATKKSHDAIRAERRRIPDLACGGLVVAPLWPKHVENLGTLARTADAVGACMAFPLDADTRASYRRGNTIGIDKVHVHHCYDPWQTEWLAAQRERGYRIVGVELAAGATPLADLHPAIGPTVLVLGHEANGIPLSAWSLLDEVVEIPMQGVGNSLNVSVAGSLVLYRLAGLA